MNTISLLPAVSAYCEERIKELDGSEIVAADSRVDELRRIVILCEGLIKQEQLLTKIVQPSIGERRTWGVDYEH